MIEHDNLIDMLLRHAPESKNWPTKIKGVSIARRDIPYIIERCLVTPVIIVTVQGQKRTVIDKKPYEYRAGQSFVLGIDIPADSCVFESSQENPYLALVLELDAVLITKIITELPKDDTDKKEKLLPVAGTQTDPAVLEAFTRLVELLDTPEHIQHLAPLIIREIHYRLLIGSLGKYIRAIYILGMQSNQIARAIKWLEKNYKAPFTVEGLANRVNMSVSTFHHNFKSLTSMSPLQFQKKLRLLEAQRLMLTEGMDASTVAYEVGYESPTQFNREYRRMFGNSPSKDIKSLLLHTINKNTVKKGMIEKITMKIVV